MTVVKFEVIEAFDRFKVGDIVVAGLQGRTYYYVKRGDFKTIPLPMENVKRLFFTLEQYLGFEVEKTFTGIDNLDDLMHQFGLDSDLLDDDEVQKWNITFASKYVVHDTSDDTFVGCGYIELNGEPFMLFSQKYDDRCGFTFLNVSNKRHMKSLLETSMRPPEETGDDIYQPTDNLLFLIP